MSPVFRGHLLCYLLLCSVHHREGSPPFSTALALPPLPCGSTSHQGQRDNTVRRWDATTGRVERTLAGHSGPVSAVAFSSDGRRITSGSDDKTLKMWDVVQSLKASKLFRSVLSRHRTYQTDQEIHTFRYISKLHFSSNGIYLMTNLGYFKVEVAAVGRSRQEAESSYCDPDLQRNPLVSNLLLIGDGHMCSIFLALRFWIGRSRLRDSHRRLSAE